MRCSAKLLLGGSSYAHWRCVRYSCILHSPTLSGSSQSLGHVKLSDALKIHDRTIFDFYPGLPHMLTYIRESVDQALPLCPLPPSKERPGTHCLLMHEIFWGYELTVLMSPFWLVKVALSVITDYKGGLQSEYYTTAIPCTCRVWWSSRLSLGFQEDLR